MFMTCALALPLSPCLHLRCSLITENWITFLMKSKLYVHYRTIILVFFSSIFYSLKKLFCLSTNPPPPPLPTDYNEIQICCLTEANCFPFSWRVTVSGRWEKKTALCVHPWQRRSAPLLPTCEEESQVSQCVQRQLENSPEHGLIEILLSCVCVSWVVGRCRATLQGDCPAGWESGACSGHRGMWDMSAWDCVWLCVCRVN